MDAKELRIGNWVIIGDNFPEQVSVETFVILYNYPERETWLKPIPLTPEILEKAGFKPLVKDWQKKGLIIHTRKRGFVVNKRIPVLKSLHQLQNLYFALTGEELPIEL